MASKKTGCCSLVTGWESGAVSSKKDVSSLARLGFDCVAARTCSMRDIASALLLLPSGLFIVGAAGSVLLSCRGKGIECCRSLKISEYFLESSGTIITISNLL